MAFPIDGRLTRRTLLAAGASLVAAAACGSDDDDASSAASTTAPSRGSTQPDELDVLVASAQILAGREERVAIGVLERGEPIAAERVELSFGRRFGDVGPPVEAVRHAEGIEERPYWLARHRFDEPGTWVVEASAGGKRGGAALEVVTTDSTEVPLVGEPMVPVATPTTADGRGVNPICTRQPACPLHDTSLDAALGEGRPTAVLFSTPALCTSRVCGPVLDVLLGEVPAFADRVRFVHVEVWRSLDTDFQADDLTEGMKAYHLTFEPVLFLAGADGVIRERLDGPYDRAEARAALDALVAS